MHNPPLVLILEDDPQLGKVYQAALRNAGFTVQIDPNGDQYETFLETQIPDLMVLDMHLPFVSGPEVLQILRSTDLWAKIPVIVVTADLFLAKSLQHKGEQVLLKPFSVLRLAELANALTGRAA
ncbi:MAG: hypothetical protein OHK0052_24420 [Anaerolineales bacterium]